jgi:hypothetical protein
MAYCYTVHICMFCSINVHITLFLRVCAVIALAWHYYSIDYPCPPAPGDFSDYTHMGSFILRPERSFHHAYLLPMLMEIIAFHFITL